MSHNEGVSMPRHDAAPPKPDSDILRIHVPVPDVFYQRIREQEHFDPDTGNPAVFKTTLVRETVKLLEQPIVAPTIPTPSRLKTAEDAAQLIVKCLDPEHQLLIYEIAKQRQLPLAAFVFSAMQLIKENGQTSVIMSGWADKSPAETVAPLPTTATCQWCQGSFIPTRDGQKFCPPPDDESDSCGRKAGLAEVRAKRDPHLVRQAYGEAMTNAPRLILAS